MDETFSLSSQMMQSVLGSLLLQRFWNKSCGINGMQVLHVRCQNIQGNTQITIQCHLSMFTKDMCIEHTQINLN